MKPNEIHLMDKVLVAPTNDSAYEIKQLHGKAATVFKKMGTDLLVVLEGGASLLLSCQEAQRVDSLADRMMAHAR